MISDLVLKRPLTEALRNSVAAYVGCVAGASLKEEYLQLMRVAGFEQVEIVAEHGYEIGLGGLGDKLQREAYTSVVSVKVRAVKRAV